MKTLITFLLFLLSNCLSAQLSESRKGLGFRTETSAIGGFGAKGGFNFGFMHATTDFMPFGYQGPFAIAGYGTSHNQTYFTSHLGYEYYYLIGAVRAGLTLNSNFDVTTVGLLPEAGLTIWGAFGILYGYNIPITNEQTLGMTKHRVTLNFTYPLWLDDEWWPLQKSQIARGL